MSTFVFSLIDYYSMWWQAKSYAICYLFSEKPKRSNMSNNWVVVYHGNWKTKVKSEEYTYCSFLVLSIHHLATISDFLRVQHLFLNGISKWHVQTIGINLKQLYCVVTCWSTQDSYPNNILRYRKKEVCSDVAFLSYLRESTNFSSR